MFLPSSKPSYVDLTINLLPRHKSIDVALKASLNFNVLTSSKQAGLSGVARKRFCMGLLEVCLSTDGLMV
jgi:hypothetical protein